MKIWKNVSCGGNWKTSQQMLLKFNSGFIKQIISADVQNYNEATKFVIFD